MPRDLPDRRRRRARQLLHQAGDLTTRTGSATGSTVTKGRAAEERVARYLEGQGFEIVARNVRAGRLELDLVARRGGLLVVCEVRSRRSDVFGHPAETIDRKKQLRVRVAAARLIEERAWRGAVRFDVATLVGEDPARAKLDYYEAAF